VLAVEVDVLAVTTVVSSANEFPEGQTGSASWEGNGHEWCGKS